MEISSYSYCIVNIVITVITWVWISKWGCLHASAQCRLGGWFACAPLMHISLERSKDLLRFRDVTSCSVRGSNALFGDQGSKSRGNWGTRRNRCQVRGVSAWLCRHLTINLTSVERWRWCSGASLLPTISLTPRCAKWVSGVSSKYTKAVFFIRIDDWKFGITMRIKGRGVSHAERTDSSG